jgi:hypothetical protein
MAEKFMQHLQNKSEEHLHIKLLHSQWIFDQELIPRALQNIVTIFPHYSRHDASHSRQILINIERMLGKTLSSMTATDTWLLLEAAYWHDIGMVITSDDIIRDIKSNEFKQYVNDIASQKNHELCAFAQQFSSLDPKDCFAAAETPQEAVELYRQILSGWYRIKHADRAADAIADPWASAGIASPRNDLVPRRLFRLLGQICRLHCSSFENILEMLPLCETGMATEDCHPRFIACLLRLGDLFDLDDNRFCSVMLRIAGKIPPSSQEHIEKHMAIRHFRLDPDRVEITAECQNPESYETTDQWFRCIENEFKNQMTHWNDIVPDREFGLLPTLGTMEVNLAPPNEVLNPGQRPHFDVDPQQTIELLQGAGIYNNSWQSLRELLQNAVDANLIRIWLTNGENPDSQDRNLDWNNPLSIEIQKIFDRYPIDVNLEKDIKSTPTHILWKLTIRDRGIGISKPDLTFMKSVGASAKNSERMAITARMPKWMRPSGAFGIGLQSAFLLSSEVEFKSNSLLTGDNLKITMTSPLGPKRGLIFIKRLKPIPGQDSGSMLSLTIETDAIPNRISWNYNDSFTQAVLADFDPVCMTDMQYEAARMVDEIIKFSNLSPFAIKLNFAGQCIAPNESAQKKTDIVKYYHEETGVMLINPLFVNENYTRTLIAFRGQWVEKYISYIPFIYFKADILGESAQEILTINRNDIKNTAMERVYDLLVKTIIGYLNSDKCQPLTLEEKSAASAFLLCHNREDVRPDLKNQWQNLTLRETNLSITELCKKDEFNLLIIRQPKNHSKKSSNEWILESGEVRGNRYKLLFKNWKDQGGYVQAKSTENNDDTILQFSKTQLPPFEDAYLKKVLLNIVKYKDIVGGRYFIPEWEKFEKLSVDIRKMSWIRSLSEYHPYNKCFILPFFFAYKLKKVTTDGLDELCAWTMKNKLNIETTEAEIYCLYNQFIDWIDDDIMKDTKEWKNLREI